MLGFHGGGRLFLFLFTHAMRRTLVIMAWRWFALVALLAAAPPGSAQDWVQWKSAAGGNNHYYALTPSATNWEAAEALAVSWGGTLATITSAKEQDFINVAFLTGALDHRPVWIGLVRTGAKGNFPSRVRRAMEDLGLVHPQAASGNAAGFEWVTGEPFSYSNWKQGEPNNSPPGEYCVAINWEYARGPMSENLKGNWNDTPWDGTRGYGANADGPYFGLVERDTDPNQPAYLRVARSVLPYALIAMLVVVLILYFARAKRRKKAMA